MRLLAVRGANLASLGAFESTFPRHRSPGRACSPSRATRARARRPSSTRSRSPSTATIPGCPGRGTHGHLILRAAR